MLRVVSQAVIFISSAIAVGLYGSALAFRYGGVELDPEQFLAFRDAADRAFFMAFAAYVVWRLEGFSGGR